MKINGYKIQHRLKELRDRRDIAASQFSNGLWQFEAEQDSKIHPNEAMATFADCEYKIARLQVLQARYNLVVEVTAGDQTMTLHEAVKRIGGAGRMEKMWRTAAASTGTDKYGYGRTMERSKENEYAQRMISVDECMESSNAASKFAASLREAIQLGNAKTIEMEADVTLFD